MGKNNGGGIVVQRQLCDLPRINASCVYRAAEKFGQLDDAVLVVKEEAGKHLLAVAAKLGATVSTGIFWAG